MTWDDFVRVGFWIEHRGRLDPALHGPRKHLDDLRFEVDSRLELVGDGSDFATWISPAREGTCAHCGDRVPNYGTCGLCALARAKALRVRRERAA